VKATAARKWEGMTTAPNKRRGMKINGYPTDWGITFYRPEPIKENGP